MQMWLPCPQQASTCPSPQPGKHPPTAAAPGPIPLRTLFSARLAVLAVTVVAGAAVSLLTTALVFDASRWPTYDETTGSAAGSVLSRSVISA